MSVEIQTLFERRSLSFAYLRSRLKLYDMRSPSPGNAEMMVEKKERSLTQPNSHNVSPECSGSVGRWL